MTETEVKSERITLRISSDEKALIIRAAAIENLDLNSLILRAVLPEAQAVTGRVGKIKLSGRETDFVIDLLDNPPKPTPKLIQAVKAATEADREARSERQDTDLSPLPEGEGFRPWRRRERSDRDA